MYRVKNWNFKNFDSCTDSNQSVHNSLSTGIKFSTIHIKSTIIPAQPKIIIMIIDYFMNCLRGFHVSQLHSFHGNFNINVLYKMNERFHPFPSIPSFLLHTVRKVGFGLMEFMYFLLRFFAFT